ncbi:hypothetical protein F5Y00DRAFT_250189 [Daldinia vernicosa]|uniref:uncharacterized protein n=1 Tax=Daldinia vernicosa TaxID=114800 RepID=UPI00200821EF|nr:uncharacterized protein F5Y00DRAFT_250189 [Daldinia vernicosa]KAI0843807.1 hypothetical protein F5Y00DRAFT_250189 [Daldinia vernicosa]
MTSIPPGIDLCSIPMSPLPDGQTEPNFVNPSSLQKTTIAVFIVLLMLTYTFVLARTWANRQKLQLSDYFTLAALLLHSSNIGIIISLSKYNRHQWDIPLCWYYRPDYLKKLYTQQITFGMTLVFSKAAILLLYLQIFGVKSYMRVAVLSA